MACVSLSRVARNVVGNRSNSDWWRISCLSCSPVRFCMTSSVSSSIRQVSVMLSIENKQREQLYTRIEKTENYFCIDLSGLLPYISHLPNSAFPFKHSWQIFDIAQWPPILNSDLPVPLLRAFQVSPHWGIGHQSSARGHWCVCTEFTVICWVETFNCTLCSIFGYEILVFMGLTGFKPKPDHIWWFNLVWSLFYYLNCPNQTRTRLNWTLAILKSKSDLEQLAHTYIFK